MAWEYIATGVGGLNIALVAYLIKSTASKIEKLDCKIDANRETVIRIYKEGQNEVKDHFNEVCDLRQSRCHGEVAKDISSNKCAIDKLRSEKKEMWQDHMRKCHREGCPE